MRVGGGVDGSPASPRQRQHRAEAGSGNASPVTRDKQAAYALPSHRHATQAHSRGAHLPDPHSQVETRPELGQRSRCCRTLDRVERDDHLFQAEGNAVILEDNGFAAIPSAHQNALSCCGLTIG